MVGWETLKSNEKTENKVDAGTQAVNVITTAKNPDVVNTAVTQNENLKKASDIINAPVTAEVNTLDVWTLLQDQTLNNQEIQKISDYIQGNKGSDDKFITSINTNAKALTSQLETFLSGNTIREDIKNSIVIVTYLSEMAKTNSSINLIKTNKLIKSNQINFIKDDMKKDGFYKIVANQYVDLVYAKEANDKGLMDYLKAKVNLEGNKKEIDSYFNNGLDVSNTKDPFWWKTINSMFDGDYSKINKTKLEISWLQALEDTYKNGEIKKDINKIIEDEIGKYAFDDVIKQTISKEMKWDHDKEVDKFSHDETKSNYKKLGQKSEFKKTINLEMMDVIAEYNKTYILQEFTKADGDQKHQEHFETMLEETENKNINTLAVALTYPNQNPAMLQALWAKIEDKWIKNSVKFTNAKIVNNKIEESKNKSTYTTTLKEEKSAETVSETTIWDIKNHIEPLVKNTNITDITISIPKWNTTIQNQIYDMVGLLDKNNAYKIKINEVDGISKVKVDSNETKEIPGKVHLELKELSYDAIWDKTKIEAALKAVNDPEMNAIIDNPDYQITGWNIYGSASFQRTEYRTQPDLVAWYQNYKNIVTVANQTKWGNGGIDNTVKTPWTQVDGDVVSWVTNNPTLAYDRAISIMDYFYKKPNKVADGAKFDVNYGVNGPSKAELLSKHPEIKDENTQKGQLENLFKEWQYAILDLDFKKTENISTTKEFGIDKTQDMTTAFQINIIGEEKTTGWNTPKMKPPVRIRKLFSWSWTFKPRRWPIPCPHF